MTNGPDNKYSELQDHQTQIDVMPLISSEAQRHLWAFIINHLGLALNGYITNSDLEVGGVIAHTATLSHTTPLHYATM